MDLSKPIEQKEKKKQKRKVVENSHEENRKLENEKTNKKKKDHKNRRKDNKIEPETTNENSKGQVDGPNENECIAEKQQTTNLEENNSKEVSSTTNDSSNVKLDRYGWFLSDKPISKEEEKLTKKEAEKECERSMKWDHMIKNWYHWSKKKMKVIFRRVEKGIPDAIRFEVWRLLLDSNHYRELYPKTMEGLLAEGENQSYSQIDRDLNRTFPQIGFFSQPAFIESLRHVLYCYSHVDPETEYTQGIGFLAGMLLVYMDEENAFYCLISLMMGKKINHRGYFLDLFPRLQRSNAMLMVLIKKKCPEIIEYFGDDPSSLSVFTTSWFLTAFQSFNFQPEFQIRIFERFLMYGTRFLISFGITIIMFHRNLFKKLQFEDVLHLLQHPDESEKMQNWHSFLELLNKEMLSVKKYESLIVKSGGKVEEFD